MLVGRCFSKLSNHELQAKSKKVTSSDRSEPGNPGERSGGTAVRSTGAQLNRKPTCCSLRALLCFLKASGPSTAEEIAGSFGKFGSTSHSEPNLSS